MATIKEKTITGLVWSFTERFASQAVSFIVGIVLARLLSPEEFGLIGMLSIFIGFASVFVQSGFNQALIRKINCTERDYATVFYFNLFVALAFYGLLVLSSNLISEFYEEPILQELIIVLSIVLIINALTIVQRTEITKRVDFKLLTRVSIISSLGSGALGITMAIYGYGVWSLVYRQLAQKGLEGGLLWFWSRWRPQASFSRAVLKDLWKFSGNLVGLAVIDIIYNNSYNVIIGKFYPAANLGQYRQADTFRKLPSTSLGSVIDRVSYPVLSKIQNDKKHFYGAFERLLRSAMLISFLLLLGLGSIAEELTVVLMGEQWILAGQYLQILVFVAMFYPLDKLLNSLLKVAGRSDLILKQGLIRKIMAIPVILTAIFVGIKAMLYVMILHQIMCMFLVSKYASRYANLKVYNLFKKIFPAFFISLVMFVFLIILGEILIVSALNILIIKIVVGMILTIGFMEVVHFKDYLYLKNEILHKMNKNIS